MANRFSANFRTRAQAGQIPTGLLELTLDGTVRRFSDAPIASVSQGMYLPRIESWGSLNYSVADRRSSLQSPELMVEIADHDSLLSNIFYGAAARSIRGSSAVVYLAYEDIAFADWFKGFDGQISSISMPRPRAWQIGLRFKDEAIAADIAELFVQTITDDNFQTADADSLGKDIPIIYGKNVFTTGGAVAAPQCSTDGDPGDSTKPNRHVVCAGYAVEISAIYVNGSTTSPGVASPVKDTDWFWTLRNGSAYTEVGFTAPNTNPVTVDVWGLSTNGNGSTTEGDLITNPAKQIEHLLTNFVFNRWKSGAWKTPGTDSPIDTASITTLETAFDNRAEKGANVLKRQSALTVLNDWAFQWQTGVWWNEDGDLQFAMRDPHDTDIYLAGNSPAEWPWFQTDIHGRRDNAVYPLTEQDNEVVDRITANTFWIDEEGTFNDARVVQDFERTLTSEGAMDLKWSQSESTVGPPLDVPSRRLRRLRFPPRQLSIKSSIALLDPDLLDGVLVSDPDAPNDTGVGWGKDKVWKARLFTLLSTSVNMMDKTVSALLEDERDYRTTFWDGGKGEIVVRQVALGVPVLHQAAKTFTRGSAAWVPNADIRIVKLGNNIPKITPDGWLFESASTNWFQNPAFVAGTTNWTVFGTTALDTAVLLFEDKTADDLGGTNQTLKMSTVSGTSSTAEQTTGHSFGASAKVALSIYHRDNTGSPIRLRVRNTSTTNWLTTGGSWSGTEQDASSFSDSAGVWVRDSLKFTMESTASTLRIVVFSGSGTTEDNHVGHVQIEDARAWPSSVMVSGASATFTRSGDSAEYTNNTNRRTLEWYRQGTIQCLYKPLMNGGDMITGTDGPIFVVEDGSNVVQIMLRYERTSGGTLRFNFAWDQTGSEATITHTVVAGQVYKVVARWIGSEGELDKSQGTLILDVFDPVGATWLTAEGTGTQNVEVGTTGLRVGSRTGAVLNGHLASMDIRPFVLSTAEARAFP